MSVFVHPQGICESTHVGDGTRVWAFAHVLEGARIGRDCNICDHVFVEDDVVLGDRVTVKCGVQLWDGIRVDDGVFIGPNATFTNDKFPRSKAHQAVLPTTLVAAGASIGANATVLPGVTIGAGAMVGAGSVVTADVPPGAVVMGNPARITGYVDTIMYDGGHTLGESGTDVDQTEMAVRGTKVNRLNVARDLRGSLSAAQFGKELPFVARRFFVVYDVPSKHVRGAHAHRECEQFLVCVKGALAVILDDGRHREEIRLDRPELGVYIPPLVWAGQYKYSADAVLLVLASHDYDPTDYIRDYAEFRAIVSG